MKYSGNYSHPGFKAVSELISKEFMSRNPISASWMGEHAYDGILPETGAEAVEKNTAFMHDMRSRLEALPENELSIDERIDRESTIYMLNRNILWHEDLKRWQCGTDLAMNIGDSIFYLFTHAFAPFSDRLQSIISRLKAVPMYLNGGKTLFQKVPALWGEVYISSAQSLPKFLDCIEKSIESNINPMLLNDFQKASAEAKYALSQHTLWLKHAVMPKAVKEWALGPGNFQAYLTAKRYGINSNELLNITQQTLCDSEVTIENLSQLILGVKTGSADGARREVQRKVNKRAPASFGQSLDALRNAIAQTRAFVQSSNFSSLPDNEVLEVMETPAFMAQLIPFSAYIAPEKTAKEQKGIYLLTRSASNDSSKYNYADIINSAIHECYPGHHLQLTGQNTHPGLLRHFCESTEIIEGWAGYCQNRVREMGFETSNESLYALAQEEIFNSTRAIADINMQTSRWDFNQAVGYLMEKNRIDRNSAIAEIRRISMNPGGQAACVVGKHLLSNLKHDLKLTFKNDFTDRMFHDLVIFQGSLPIDIAKKYYPELIIAQLKTKSR